MNKQLLQEKVAERFDLPAEAIRIEKVLKNNGVMKNAVSFHKVLPDTNVSPNIYIDDILKSFSDEEQAAAIISNRIAKTLKSAPIPESIILDKPTILNGAFIQVIGTENNRELLKTLPHRELADLAIAVRSVINIGKDGSISSALVSKDIMETFDIEEDELFDTAIKNTRKKCVYECTPIVKAMSDLCAFSATEKIPEEVDSHMYVVSNTKKLNGAAVLAFPDLMQYFIKVVGGNALIIPSSIHEILLVTEFSDIASLKEMVMSVNATVVEPEEVLSNSIYTFDSDSMELRVIA